MTQHLLKIKGATTKGNTLVVHNKRFTRQSVEKLKQEAQNLEYSIEAKILPIQILNSEPGLQVFLYETQEIGYYRTICDSFEEFWFFDGKNFNSFKNIEECCCHMHGYENVLSLLNARLSLSLKTYANEKIRFLPDLIGSQKQIKWAVDIRENFASELYSWPRELQHFGRKLLSEENQAQVWIQIVGNYKLIKIYSQQLMDGYPEFDGSLYQILIFARNRHVFENK